MRCRSRANIGRWGKGRGENIAIFLTSISAYHVQQLCSSLSQTNYSIIVGIRCQIWRHIQNSHGVVYSIFRNVYVHLIVFMLCLDSENNI